MRLQINEYKVVVRAKQEIKRKDIITEQRNLINSSLMKIDYLKELHENRKERIPYVFNSIFTDTNTLEKGKVYEFTLRSFDKTLLDDLSNAILFLGKSSMNHTFLDVVRVRKTSKSLGLVTSVLSDTPILLLEKDDKNRTIVGDDLNLCLNELNRTTVFKYNRMTDSNVPEDLEVFTAIEMKKPVVKVQSSYKGKDFYKLGFVADFETSFSKDAQKVLEFCLNIGVGSSCSFLGAGFLWEGDSLNA